jgi:hypothetical protein
VEDGGDLVTVANDARELLEETAIAEHLPPETEHVEDDVTVAVVFLILFDALGSIVAINRTNARASLD